MDAAPTPPPKSRKSSRLGLIIAGGVVAVVVGFAWQAFRNMRLHSEEEDVLCLARELSAAADQYFLENGVTSVRFDQLVGSSNYLKGFGHVAGESYPDAYTKGITLTVRGVAGAETVTYVP